MVGVLKHTRMEISNKHSLYKSTNHTQEIVGETHEEIKKDEEHRQTGTEHSEK